jgi:hypothetical protein
MTARPLTLYHQTRLAIHIIIEDESGMLAGSILLVTTLFTLVWAVGRFVASASDEVSLLVREIKAALIFTGKVLVIGFSALAYGLGVTP